MPSHLEDDLAETAAVGFGRGQDLGLPAIAFGEAGVHAEQIRGKERGLIAPGPGANLDDDVLVVVGVLRNQ